VSDHAVKSHAVSRENETRRDETRRDAGGGDLPERSELMRVHCATINSRNAAWMCSRELLEACDIINNIVRSSLRERGGGGGGECGAI
jgi:hypothetical protein